MQMLEDDEQARECWLSVEIAARFDELERDPSLAVPADLSSKPVRHHAQTPESRQSLLLLSVSSNNYYHKQKEVNHAEC